MIVVKHSSGNVTYHSYAIISGGAPIGVGRPLPSDATLELSDSAVIITSGETRPVIIWPWDKITELELGPVVEADSTLLREGDAEDIPF